MVGNVPRLVRCASLVLTVLSIGCGAPSDDRAGVDEAAGEVSAATPTPPSNPTTAPSEMPTTAQAEPSMPGFPYRVEPACPGEGCTYGAWLACDTLELRAGPSEEALVTGRLAPNQTFEVSTGAVIVQAPEVVVVTRPTPLVPFQESSPTLAPGDTLYVLDYLGEGFFNAWYADSIVEVEVFWPWEPFYPGDDFEYGGEVVRPGASEFWVRTIGPEGAESWLRADLGGIAVPSSIDPAPPMCG